MHCPPRNPDSILDRIDNLATTWAENCQTVRLPIQTLRTVPSDSDSGAESIRGAQTVLLSSPPDPVSRVVL